MIRTFIILVGGIVAAALTASYLSNTGDMPTEEVARQAFEEQSQARYDAKWAAIEACRASVLGRTALPGKADFYAGVTALSDDAIEWSVAGTVDLMNEYGAMIPHRYGCVVNGSETISIGLGPS